jgi:hypothetical protein
LQGDEFSVDANVKKFKTTLDAPAFSLPRHNSSTQLLAELPDDLLRRPASPLPLQRPLRRPAVWTLLLHHQGWVMGQDHL